MRSSQSPVPRCQISPPPPGVEGAARVVLELELVLGPMEILRGRGDASLGSSTSTALRAEYEYEYEGGRARSGLSLASAVSGASGLQHGEHGAGCGG